MEKADKDKVKDDTKPSTKTDLSPIKTTTTATVSTDAMVTTPDKTAEAMDTSLTKSTPGTNLSQCNI